MRQTAVGALLLSALPALTTGCSGSVPLKRSKSFTPAAVKAIQYDDVCKLQGYFDARPKSPDELQSSLFTNSADAGGRGRVTLRLKPGLQNRTFKRLLRTFYHIDERLLSARQMRVTVPFFEPVSGGEGRRLPIGAEVQVHGPKGPVSLAYHPCVGEFFFGERVYEARRQVFGPARVDSGPKSRRDAFRSAIPSVVH